MDDLHAKKTREDWTDEEKALFAKGLEKYADYGIGRWKKIAEEFVTSKTYEQVAQFGIAYVKKLEKGHDPNEKLKNTPWTDAEKALFAKGLEKHGKGKWKEIAEEFVTTKTVKQVANFGIGYVKKLETGLDPNKEAKRIPWTEEEHALFMQGLETYGRQWTKIADEFVKSRTPDQVYKYAVTYLKMLAEGRNPHDRQQATSWTDKEEALFVKGLEKHGRKWKKIAEEFVTTKTPQQVANFSKTYFKRLAKKEKAAVSTAPDTATDPKPHPVLLDAQDLANADQQISSDTHLEVEEGDPMEYDDDDDLAESSGKGVKRSRMADPEHDSDEVWREKALDLQEKVVLLQSVLDRVTPMVQDLRRIDMNRTRAPSQESLDDAADDSPGAFGISDKCQMVENLLEILHTSARPPPADEFAGKDYHEIDQICKMRAFEETLWLLPSFWQESSISELSFVHLEALARDITGDLLERREDLSFDDPKTGRILSLVLHLTGLVCSCDPFDCNEGTMPDDVQQIHSTKESCMAILQTLGRHPAINLYTLQSAVRHLLERTSAALWDNPVPYHLFLEDFYWILHLLEVTLDNESARLSDSLAISKWQVVKDVTDNIIQVERILLQGDTQLSHNTLFMTKWKEIMKKVSAYFLFKYGNDDDLRQPLEPEEAFESEEEEEDDGPPFTICDGQRIEVLFQMPMDNPSQFFLGTIRQRADGKFDVQYDDGDIDLDFDFDSPENLYMFVHENTEDKQ